MMVQCLLNGNKVMTCGVSGGMLLADHMADMLVNHFEIERPLSAGLFIKLAG